MPVLSKSRELPVRSRRPLRLVLIIALGIWLGFMALGLSAWLIYKTLYTPIEAPAAISNLTTPQSIRQPQAPALPAIPSDPALATQNHMFEQYQENLSRQETSDAVEQARRNPDNFANPKCQFWLQQAQTAPSDKSRGNVLMFCN
ncbi:MAG: hypothetical protein ACRYF9_08940 [Janthinobacterium lividum]|uniref:hypothetical protein n=1 Tax=Pseudomonas TaxID=286 RepID=UPI001CFB3F6C|nr:MULTISPECIES: hypothetical protein [Pseudomonas]